MWLWDHTTLRRKGTPGWKNPAAYSSENPLLFFPDFGLLQRGDFLFKFWHDKVTLSVVYQKGFFQGNLFLQWWEDAIACPAKFIWKGSFAINQSIFFSYHRQKRLFEKQTGAFLFSTTATILTAMLKLISQTPWISGQKEKPEEKPEEVWVAAQ